MLKVIRFWVPTVISIAGLVVIVAGGASEHSLEVGIPIFSTGLSIWLLNFLFRVGVAGDHERDAEDDARAYFAKHGRWPNDPGAGGARGGQR